MNTMTSEWIRTLSWIFSGGSPVSPRGMLTQELQQHTICVDMNHPVLLIPERKLQGRFLAAEAYWMLSGDDTVEGIAPWNKHIAAFSDDGVRFFGAYGPKIVDQLPHVVNTLLRDPDSRQAVMTTWRENPPATKDVPCTIAFAFMLRDGRLNLHVFMRSSDVWLGLPYDVFNFSMVAHLVCCRLNAARPPDEKKLIVPGKLHLTAASSHLYEKHFDEAHAILEHYPVIKRSIRDDPMTPILASVDEAWLMANLREARDDKTRRWWHAYLTQ